MITPRLRLGARFAEIDDERIRRRHQDAFTIVRMKKSDMRYMEAYGAPAERIPRVAPTRRGGGHLPSKASLAL